MPVKPSQQPAREAERELAPRPPGGGGRVNSLWVRRQNAALLFRALRQGPGSSQRQLGEATGLDKATISAVVAQLVEAGLVERSGVPRDARPTRQGRPEVALDVPATAGLVFGARLEPNRIDVVAADLAGRIRDRETVAGAAGVEASIDHLAEAVEALAQRQAPLPIHALGLGIPALITAAGHLVLAPNLDWHDVPIGPLVRARLAMPVLIENDATAAAIAEQQFGSCDGIEDFVYLAGHSGVGGAMVVGGRLYRGADGMAGEVGHIQVVEGGRRCGCGGIGCLEAHTSEQALLCQAREQGLAVESGQDLARLAAAGEPLVLSLLGEAGRLFARALAAMVNLLNPERIVLGGNLAVVAPWMLASLRAELDRLALAPLARPLDIELSPLGTDAVVMGGVALALDEALTRLLETRLGRGTA